MNNIHPALLVAAVVLAYIIVAGFVCGVLDVFWPWEGHHDRPPNPLVAVLWPLAALCLLLCVVGYILYCIASQPYRLALAMFAPPPPRDLPTPKELDGMKEPTL